MPWRPTPPPRPRPFELGPGHQDDCSRCFWMMGLGFVWWPLQFSWPLRRRPFCHRHCPSLPWIREDCNGNISHEICQPKNYTTGISWPKLLHTKSALIATIFTQYGPPGWLHNQSKENHLHCLHLFLDGVHCEEWAPTASTLLEIFAGSGCFFTGSPIFLLPNGSFLWSYID